MASAETQYDVVVIGGGPGGATAALVLAREGHRVLLLLERGTFPRFHIGESFLPRNFTLIQELGLGEELDKLPHVPKFGAEFGMGYMADTTRFLFDEGYYGGPSRTFNVERSKFDHMLIEQARAAGVEVRHGIGVKRIIRLSDGDVAIETDRRTEIDAKFLIDASGHGTVVGRHLGTRRACPDKHLQKVAYFGHFENVKRRDGIEAGHPGIIMCDEGWFWLIPLDKTKTSVGFVAEKDLIRKVDVPANRMLAWATGRCPLVKDRMARATGPANNHVLADFSYRCEPYAGPGYFLVGDAAVFLDPIFSTGACLAMMGAVRAADHVGGIIDGTRSPEEAREDYVKFIAGSSGVYFRLIKNFYDHSFRELFLNGTGPMKVHKAVLAVLAGHVFPEPAWELRWRLNLFEAFVQLNRFLPLVPRRKRFSLLKQGEAADVKPAGVSVGKA